MKLREFLTPDNLGRGLDQIVGILSPEAALKRSQMRTISENKRLFDGATKGRRGQGWKKLGDDSPKDQTRYLSTLRNRSRDFSRNDGYAKKAVDAIASNTIGTGIVLQLKSKRKNGRADISEAWKKWTESTACDFDGLTTFYGLQELAVKTIVESGEVLIRKRILDSKYFAKTKQVPLQIQVMEPEFLCETLDTAANGNKIVSGIEFDADGRKIAYHVYQRHPSLEAYPPIARVPADEIIHVYRIDRAGQLRGVPWAAPIMLTLHDLGKYEDFELVRRQVASCFSAFVSTPDIDDGEATPDESYIDRMEPGMIEVLPPGKTVTFGAPPQVTGYSEYATSVLHRVAAGYQVPYSVLTGDFSQVNFSSGRMGWLEFQRLIEQWRWNMIIPRMLNPIWAWFSEVADLVNYSSDQVLPQWTAPRREMIDPLKEIEAISLAVKAGLQSLPEAILELGYDPDTVIEQIKDFNAKLDAASIILDSDPRQDPKRLAAKNVALKTQTV